MKTSYDSTFSPPALMVPIIISGIDQNMKKEVLAKIDTGSDISMIPRTVIEEL